MFLKELLCILVSVCFLQSFCAGQVTRQAPTAAYPSIQSAVLASSSGDIIEVLPGNWTLFIPIDFFNKNLILRSTAGAAQTTLSGTGNKLIVAGGQDSTSVIDGITFTGSVGPAFGGAFVLAASSPTFKNCKFVNNVRLDGSDAHGAAGALYFSNSVFINCFFDGNKAGKGPVETVGNFYTNFGGFGGALFIANSNISFTDCGFINNEAGAGGQGSPEVSPVLAGPGGFGGDGGAIYAENSNLDFLRCAFANNFSGDGGEGGLDSTGVIAGANGPAGQGGAIRTFGVLLNFDECLFSGNRTGLVPAPGGGSVVGGRGGAISTGSGATAIRKVSFVGNQAEEGGALNLDFIAGPTTIHESTFAANSARGNGGAIIQRNGMHLDSANNIFAGNSAFLGSVIAVDATVLPAIDVFNSIAYFNFGPAFEASSGFTQNQTFNVLNSDVEGGFPGAGNIDADPLWASPFSLNFHLLPNSPCIDQGDSTLTTSVQDFELEPRVVGSAIDMGADEFYGLSANADGTVFDGNGMLEDTVTINGGTGTPGRIFHTSPTQGFFLNILNPSLNASPAQFIIYGTLGIPSPADGFPLLFAGGSMAFTPFDADPTNPSLFILADNIAQNPVAIVPATLAPWSLVVPPLGMPVTFTLQGAIQGSQGTFRITNAIVVIAE